MMFANAEDVEADLIGKLNLFEQMVHALDRAERETCGRVGNSCCETVDSNLHLCHFSKTTYIRLIGVLRGYVKVGFKTLV